MTTLHLNKIGHYPPKKRFSVDACVAGFVNGKEPFTWFDTAGGAKVRGVEVVNTRTGNMIRFIFRRTVQMAGGAIAAWVFDIHPRSVATHHGLVGYTLTIYAEDAPEDVDSDSPLAFSG